MTIPNVGEEEVLNKLLNQVITMKLFSNNVTPAEATTAASFTEVAGGGYADIDLAFAGWTITPGDPTIANYAQQTFIFTGPTNAPSTIYGYYLVNPANVLVGAERFAAGVVPFTPVAGSRIAINPRIQTS